MHWCLTIVSPDAALNDAVTNLDDRSLSNDVDGHVLQSFLEAQMASFGVVFFIFVALLWLQFPRVSLGALFNLYQTDIIHTWSSIALWISSYLQGEHAHMLPPTSIVGTAAPDLVFFSSEKPKQLDPNPHK